MKAARLILIALFALLVAAPALAITSPKERLSDPALEARALDLTRKLRCVVCQNESVEDSHADIARDLRALVRKQIGEGMTDDQVIDFLRARYGDYILLDPPFAPRTYLLWLAPALVFAGGAWMAAGPLKRLNRRRGRA